MNNYELPLISVVIPFMNEERFLEETILSVINQTYQNWELILVDDGSTNTSTDIAKKFASLYPDRIKYIEHENHMNKGVCVSRNLGVDKANGSLIALLDADDIFLPKKLEEQIDYFYKYPEIGMVAEASIYWSSWSDESIEDRIVKVGGENDKVTSAPQLMYDLYPLGHGNAPCPCSIMIKKEVVLNVGGFVSEFKKEYQLYEDQAFLVKVYLSEKVYISSNSNNLYRQRPDSVVYSVHRSGEYHKVRSFFLEWLEKYLKSNNIKEKKIYRLLDKAILRYRRPMYYKYVKTLPKRIYDFSRIKLALCKNKF